MPSSRASPLPDPLGTIASVASAPTSADPISFDGAVTTPRDKRRDPAPKARQRQLARVTRTFGHEHFGTEPALLGERRGLLRAHASHVTTSTSP